MNENEIKVDNLSDGDEVTLSGKQLKELRGHWVKKHEELQARLALAVEVLEKIVSGKYRMDESYEIAQQALEKFKEE